MKRPLHPLQGPGILFTYCRALRPLHPLQGPGILFTPVKTMKEAKGFVPVGECLPLNKCKVLHPASDAAIKAGKAVTVLTYLHGVKEANM